MAALAPVLIVDLQVARLPEPIYLRRDSSETEIYPLFAPGFHGLRQSHRHPEESDGPVLIWPASSLAANYSPQDQVRQLLGKRNRLNIRKVTPEVGRTDVQRFEVIHFTRVGLNHPAEQLVRGNRLVPTNGLTEPTIAAMSERLAAHLIKRQHQDGAFRGTFLPTADRFKQDHAGVEETALAAYALTRYANTLRTVAISMTATDSELASQALNSAKRAVTFSSPYLLNKAQPPQPTALALMLMTIVDSPVLGDHKRQRNVLGQRILGLRDDDGLFRTSSRSQGQNGGRRLSPTGQAMMVAALAALYEQTRDAPLGQKIDASLDRIWQSVGDRPLIGALPWLIEASLRMRHPQGDPPNRRGQANTSIPKSQRVATVIDIVGQLRNRLITQAPAIGPPDVIGGFELTGKSRGAPTPDWRSAEGLFLLALARRYPRLVEGQNVIRYTLDCVLAARFLAQLMVDEPSCFYMRRPDVALGGVRASLYDNTLGVTPTAMTLLAVAELQQMLAGLDGEPLMD